MFCMGICGDLLLWDIGGEPYLNIPPRRKGEYSDSLSEGMCAGIGVSPGGMLGSDVLLPGGCTWGITH